MKSTALLLILFGVAVIILGLVAVTPNPKTTETDIIQLTMVGSGAIFLASGILWLIFFSKPRKGIGPR
jgi:uncharacterized membrane protein HdeD (DUF308 family)